MITKFILVLPSLLYLSLTVPTVLKNVGEDLFRGPDRYERVDSGRRFDTYGVLPKKEGDARLDNFGTQLTQEPKSKGYVDCTKAAEMVSATYK